MWSYHLLFINTGSGNAPHCQPNPLSLHLVPWQGGGGVGAAVTRYRAPDVLWIRLTGVFTPFQILQHVCWWGRCVMARIDSCYSSGFCPVRHPFYLNHPFSRLVALLPLILFLCLVFTYFYHYVTTFSCALLSISISRLPLPPLFHYQLSTSLSSPLWHLPKVCSGCSPSVFGCHWGPATAATVVGHGAAAAVILYSPVLHLSCTASLLGVIPSDLLWRFKCSA